MSLLANLYLGDNRSGNYTKEYLVTACHVKLARRHNDYAPDADPRCDLIHVTIVAPDKDNLELQEWYIERSALSGKIVIANREFPAPTAGVLAMLEQIQSPFIAEGNGKVEQLDILRALYLLSEREKALLPILRIRHLETQLEAIPEPSDAAALFVLIEQRKKLADVEAEFDAAALRFGESLGTFDVAEAANDIGAYLALASGFEMLPDPEEGSKKKSGGISIC